MRTFEKGDRILCIKSFQESSFERIEEGKIYTIEDFYGSRRGDGAVVTFKECSVRPPDHGCPGETKWYYDLAKNFDLTTVLPNEKANNEEYLKIISGNERMLDLPICQFEK